MIKKNKMQIAREVVDLINKYEVIEVFGGRQGAPYQKLLRMSVDPDEPFDREIQYLGFYNLNETQAPLILKLGELQDASTRYQTLKMLKFWKWFRR